MPKTPSIAKPALRILAVLGSVGLLVYLVWHAGPGKLWLNLVKLGWGFIFILALAGIVLGVKAAGHRAGWGIQFSSPYFLVAMTTLVTLIALNLF